MYNFKNKRIDILNGSYENKKTELELLSVNLPSGVISTIGIQVDTDEEWNWMITKLQVKMNGVDITRSCRFGFTIFIPYVTGDVEVIAVAKDMHTGRDWDPKKYPRK